MADLKPNLASYARVSYFRELHGDLAGAATAMRLAASAGGDAAENLAYVQTLVGNIALSRGQVREAAQAFGLALSRYSRYAPAQAGLARVSAARGDLERSIRLYRAVVTRLPLPEYAIALGETELAAGRSRAARRDFELVQVQQRLQRGGGVNVDAQIAVFEADHGDRQRGLRLARRAWQAAPSVRSADALGWALTRAGQPEDGLRWGRLALKLGSRDPLFLYHAGVSATRAGETTAARRYLRRSLADNPEFSPYFAPLARRALEALT
jgi:tetratricopeptide (TPR) repeat protein